VYSEFASEMPQRQVFISAFYMDETEVTNNEYRACAAAGFCDPPDAGSGTYSRSNYYDQPANYGNYPVVYVSWGDARNYCAWAGKRLPTEAEWEKAARGTDGRIYPWGNTFDTNRANTEDRGTEIIMPVGQYPSGATPYGLLDMSGNVWEYVNDWFDPDYYASAPDRDPPGPNASPFDEKVLRSGSYANYQHYARVANRGSVTATSSTQFRGFRCVIDANAVGGN
jgi:formylglycine-generating enzyme required for sulfatase activity